MVEKLELTWIGMRVDKKVGNSAEKMVIPSGNGLEQMKVEK